MFSLSALVLATNLLAAAPETLAAPDEDPFAAPAAQPKPARRPVAQSSFRRSGKHTFFGLVLETGAALLYLGTGAMTVGLDANLPPEGCNAASKPCAMGTPIFVFLPAGATTLGWIGASRFAAANDANMWRSPLFWTGTALALGAYLAWGMALGQQTRNPRLVWDTTGITMAVVGTALQVAGAVTAPKRDPDPDDYAFRLMPGCGPTASRGLVCGLSWTGF
jgi:hypothetical protein